MNPTLTGLSFIGFQRGQNTGTTFQAENPSTGETLEPPYQSSTEEEVASACRLAEGAFNTYRQFPHTKRAEFLEEIATNIEKLGTALTSRFVVESGLPEGRAQGECARTCGQLRLFASEIKKKAWNRPVIETAIPDRKPLPKPDTRLRYVPIGPVGVFGPANFPLAFSVAGGDTASALAAGCPVVVKAHTSHPGVSELVGIAIIDAAKSTGMPEGVFSLMFGDGWATGAALVQNSAIKAIGFTGSESGGRALFDLASARAEPIPFFAEMSSLNPIALLPNALENRLEEIAQGLYESLTLGVGQFCTNPGLVLVPENELSQALLESLKAKLEKHPAQAMLNRGTRRSYDAGQSRLSKAKGIETVLATQPLNQSNACAATPALYKISCADFIRQKELHKEVFGPTTLLVTCNNAEDYRSLLTELDGQLTISFHAEENEINEYQSLISIAETKAGRIVFNSFPTGVEVCDSMIHSGPYPATTDSRFTSVGTRAIDRFLRPICYQGFPSRLLPNELK